MRKLDLDLVWIEFAKVRTQKIMESLKNKIVIGLKKRICEEMEGGYDEFRNLFPSLFSLCEQIIDWKNKQPKSKLYSASTDFDTTVAGLTRFKEMYDKAKLSKQAEAIDRFYSDYADPLSNGSDAWINDKVLIYHFTPEQNVCIYFGRLYKWAKLRDQTETTVNIKLSSALMSYVYKILAVTKTGTIREIFEGLHKTKGLESGLIKNKSGDVNVSAIVQQGVGFLKGIGVPTDDIDTDEINNIDISQVGNIVSSIMNDPNFSKTIGDIFGAAKGAKDPNEVLQGFVRVIGDEKTQATLKNTIDSTMNRIENPKALAIEPPPPSSSTAKKDSD